MSMKKRIYMVSEAYRKIEDRTGTLQTLQTDMVESIAHHLNKDKQVIERALYLACVGLESTPTAVARGVDEFLASLADINKMQKEEKKP